MPLQTIFRLKPSIPSFKKATLCYVFRVLYSDVEESWPLQLTVKKKTNLHVFGLFTG